MPSTACRKPPIASDEPLRQVEVYASGDRRPFSRHLIPDFWPSWTALTARCISGLLTFCTSVAYVPGYFGMYDVHRSESHGEHAPEVERGRRPGRVDFLGAIRVNEFHKRLSGSIQHLDDAALLVILPLALNLARFVAGRVDFKGDVGGELSHDRDLRTCKPLLAHQRCVGTTPVAGSHGEGCIRWEPTHSGVERGSIQKGKLLSATRSLRDEGLPESFVRFPHRPIHTSVPRRPRQGIVPR